MSTKPRNLDFNNQLRDMLDRNCCFDYCADDRNFSDI